MSEKRFTIHKESKYKEEWYAYPFCIKEDGEVVLETIPLSIAEKVRDKLNKQQDTIKELEKNYDDIVQWASEIAKRNVILDEKIGKLQKELQKQ